MTNSLTGGDISYLTGKSIWLNDELNQKITLAKREEVVVKYNRQFGERLTFLTSDITPSLIYSFHYIEFEDPGDYPLKYEIEANC